MTLADKIVVLKDGQVMQIGAPMDLYHDPANLFVAGFLGAPSMNFIEVRVQAVNGGTALVSNDALDPVEVSAKRGPFRAGDTAILGLRPQYLSVTQGQGRLHGAVALTERLGAETVVEVTLKNGKPVIAALGHDAVFAIGAPVNLDFDPAQAHLFPREG
jgi:multiple sugar transport system ATP-binding protein